MDDDIKKSCPVKDKLRQYINEENAMLQRRYTRKSINQQITTQQNATAGSY